MTARFPVAVVIHGGWWRAAYGLTYTGHLCEALTSDGFATWNIEYRRVGNAGGGYPGTLHDVTAALNALHEIAQTYPLDLTRVVATGHSAGGHLAAWLAAKSAHRDLDDFGPPFALKGAVPVAGVLDLVHASALRVSNMGEIPVHDFLGGTPDDVPEHYAFASPTAWLPTGIPVIAVHGTDDENVPIELSRRYVQRAQAAGDRAKLVVLDGIDHFEPFDPATKAGAVVWDAVHELLMR